MNPITGSNYRLYNELLFDRSMYLNPMSRAHHYRLRDELLFVRCKHIQHAVSTPLVL